LFQSGGVGELLALVVRGLGGTACAGRAIFIAGLETTTNAFAAVVRLVLSKDESREAYRIVPSQR
jgi:hypothetical protein